MPFDPNELPALGSANSIPEVTPDWLKILKSRKITGLLGNNISYEIKPRKAQIHGSYGNLNFNGLLGYDGNWSADAGYPLFDGLLKLQASGKDGNNNYGLQYQKVF